MNLKKNISREVIADTIHDEFGFSRKECLEIVNDILENIKSSQLSPSVLEE